MRIWIIKMTALRFNICLLLLLAAFPAILSAQEELPKVLMLGSAEHPATGTSWTLTMMVAHNEPKKISVLAPSFPDAIFLDQMLKGPRYYNPATGQSILIPNEDSETSETYEEPAKTFELWTAVEYRFTLLNAEAIIFEPFTVFTPQGEIQTEPFTLEVQGPQRTTSSAAGQTYRLAWEGVPAELKIGESAAISLRIANRNSAATLPSLASLPVEMFMPAVPPGHIVESLPLPPEERAAGKVLSLRIIPLAAVPFTAGRRQLSHNAVNFEIPAIRIPVKPLSRESSPSREGAPSKEGVPSPESPAPEKNSVTPPFPLLETAANRHTELYKRYHAEYENIYGTAKNLWERGYRANSLATLRQNERDHRAGVLFSALRREAEQAAGLIGTNDEKARNFFSFFGKKPAGGVLKETSLRLIPDMAGEEIARCKEGQPVLAAPLAGRGTAETANRRVWRRIITNDSRGLSGWVPEENIIFY